MLNNIRNFSKTIFAKILLVIIIIPFVFWGMGGVFSGGNTNNIAKINSQSISTQEFVDHINSTKINMDYIKANVEKNILEEILSDLISKTMISLEVKSLNLIISDKILNKKIKGNEKFQDDNKKFSRTAYEKFLLLSNISAHEFELKLKEDELKKNLFSYIDGGIKEPFFLTNKVFKEQTKKITLNYINLENVYKKKNDFLDSEILNFINENQDILKEKKISFSYTKIKPENLTGSNEYSKIFYKKIDEIENKISNGKKFDKLLADYKLKSISKENFTKNSKINDDNNDIKIFEKIFDTAESNKIGLLEENDFYILYKIYNNRKILPTIDDPDFKKRVKKLLFNKSKYEFNNNLLKKINEKNFKQENFEKISKINLSKIQEVEIQSIQDNKRFTVDSVKFLYTLTKNSFALISDTNNNVYISKILNIYENDLSKSSEDFQVFNDQANIKIKNQIFESYDFLLNSKYKVKVNEKSLERVKNYFK